MYKVTLTIKETKDKETKEPKANVNIKRDGNDKSTELEITAGINIYNAIIDTLQKIG